METSNRYQSVLCPGLFAGQLHIVTGGGSGIGRCTAHELASLGAEVVLIGRKIEKLKRVQEEILFRLAAPGRLHTPQRSLELLNELTQGWLYRVAPDAAQQEGQSSERPMPHVLVREHVTEGRAGLEVEPVGYEAKLAQRQV